MSFELIAGLVALAAYLLGSVSFAIVVSRLRGLEDPRTYGSHNPGATNVLRSGDKLAAALTLAGDAAKGWVVVTLARVVAVNFLPLSWQDGCLSLAAFAVFLGHLFPVYFRFQGGKGVATAFGVLLALDLWLGLGVGVIWLFIFKASGISALAALTAAIAGPVITLVRHDLGVMFWSVLAISALLIYRHKENIRRMISGEEKSFKR